MKLKIISAEDFMRYIKRDDILLIDLRERNDYDKEHIEGAIYADWEKLDENIDFLIDSCPHKINWIILYCDHGNISLLTARDLARRGYPVISLTGGYARLKKRHLT